MPPELSVLAFSGSSLAIIALITAYLLLAEPLWGRRMFESGVLVGSMVVVVLLTPGPKGGTEVFERSTSTA